MYSVCSAEQRDGHGRARDGNKEGERREEKDRERESADIGSKEGGLQSRSSSSILGVECLV